MAGIYIHIPFCKTKCAYCDFYSIANLSQSEIFIQTLKSELINRKNYLSGQKIETIYFGGGTPSLISASNLSLLLDSIYSNYKVVHKPEITIEVNPDDFSKSYSDELLNLGFNRLSIGIQSLNDDTLKFLQRRHNSKQALVSIETALNTGFKNISVDIIFGIPQQPADEPINSLEKILNFPVQHISAYHLTFEPGTLFGKKQKKGEITPIGENESYVQFNTLIDYLERNGFIQYEISNFSLPGMESRHNSSYWKQVPYLGAGPSAHSYNIESRQWNTAKLSEYLKNPAQPETEILTQTDKYNELIMTSLRTMWGLDKLEIKKIFGSKKLQQFEKSIFPFIRNGYAVSNENKITLTRKGLFISDTIFSALFL